MEELEPKLSDEETFRVGEGLYGLSIHELEARIAAYHREIERLKGELGRKANDRLAADTLFSSKPS